MRDKPVADLILQRLTQFETEYWYDVDFNWGRNAHTFYADDGVFVIGDSRMAGRDEGSEDAATLRCILLLYAADGSPVLPSLPAILIADVLSHCIPCPDGRYRFRSHVLSPVFMGGEAPTVPPGETIGRTSAALP